jgi:hypothetical protein
LSPKRTGIEGVRVKVDAKERAKSDSKGEYTLEKVSTNTNKVDESWNLYFRS